MADIVKICKKHGELNYIDIYINKKGWKICRICLRDNAKKHRKENKEKVSIRNKNWIAKNPNYRKNLPKDKKDILNIRQKKYYHKNNTRYKELRKTNSIKIKNRDKKNTDSLSNCYVRKLLMQRSNLIKNDIPLELIELKRVVIKIKRKIKERCNDE